jgi:hypothetical protein
MSVKKANPYDVRIVNAVQLYVNVILLRMIQSDIIILYIICSTFVVQYLM